MKRILPILILFSSWVVVSCKSTGTIETQVWGHSDHGVDGDKNVWMKAPPAGEGLQIAVQPFIVPGDSVEVQGNFYFHLPTSVPFDVGVIEIAMNEGTHHMNMYKSTVKWPADSGIPRPIVFTHLDGKVDTQNVRYQAEFNATIVRNGGDMMVEAQVPYLNWTFPKLPTGEQTSVHFGANDTVIIENHYVNVPNLNGGGSQLTPNGKGKIIINLWKAQAASTVHASMMFARKTTSLIIPKYSDTVAQKSCYFSPTTLRAAPIYMLGMTGHYHSRGKNFWVEKRRAIHDGAGALISDSLIATIYRSPSWDEPPFAVFDPPIQLNLAAGDYIKYYAEYVNNTGNVIKFGPHVAVEEHMNLFTWFAPGWNDGQTLYDDVSN
ncbi:MAG: hypothetical protein WCH46_10080 [bacterium]